MPTTNRITAMLAAADRRCDELAEFIDQMRAVGQDTRRADELLRRFRLKRDLIRRSRDLLQRKEHEEGRF